MSLDFLVYLPVEVNMADFGLVSAGDGLWLDAEFGFTVDGPAGVDDSDVPDTVFAVARGSRFQLLVSADGMSARAVKAASVFTKRVASDCDGVVYDAQLNTVWPKSVSVPVRPERESRVEVVELTWYFCSSDHERIIRAWLSECQRYLPEALPRRYGGYEPLQLKFEGEAQGFIDAAFDPENFLGIFFSTTYPCMGGSVDGPAISEFGGETRTMQLTIMRDALNSPGWREAARRLFCNFGLASGAFFASAEVVGGWIWNGRSLVGDEETRTGQYLARRGTWVGLPPVPVWWAWFGPEYAALVGAALQSPVTRFETGAVFTALAGLPESSKILIARNGTKQWLPEELTAQALVGEEDSWVPAAIIPSFAVSSTEGDC